VVDGDGVEAGGLDTGRGSRDPQRAEPHPDVPVFHIKPLIWSKESSGPARIDGCGVVLEQRKATGSDGGSD
jgi:hypothetical protein